MRRCTARRCQPLRVASAGQQDPAGLAQLRNPIRGVSVRSAQIRVRGPQRLPEASLNRSLLRRVAAAVEPEHLQRPANRITHRPWPRARRPAVAEIREQRLADVSTPCHPLPNGLHRLHPKRHRQPARGVHRAEQQLARGRPRSFELAHEALVGIGRLRAVQPLTAPGQTNPIMLKPMPKPRLRDLPAFLKVIRELHGVCHGLVGEFGAEGGTDRTEQHPAVTGARTAIGFWQQASAQSDPAGGSDGPGVEDLQFSQQHPVNLAERDRRLGFRGLG